MKQLLTTAAVMLAMTTANAANFTVYNDGTVGEGLVYYGWWNAGYNPAATNPDGEGKAMSFKAADGGAAASMGLNLESGLNTGKLHDATLNFNWYAEGTGKYTIRLTAVSEENYSFEVTAENAGKWNTTSLDVATVYPKVAKEWNENKKGDGKGYVFSVVLENGSADAVIYFNDIYYSNVDEAWVAPEKEDLAPKTVPTPTTSADDVISVFGSSYPAATNFNIGGWGQSTVASVIEVDGKQVYKLLNFNYLGWELNPSLDITKCNYMHVDFYPTAETEFGFTPISPGKERSWIAPEVKVKEWNSYDVPLSFFTEAGVNLADIFQIKFDQGNEYQVEVYVTNVYFYNNGETPVDPIDPVEPVEPNGQTFKGSVDGTASQTENDVVNEYSFTLEYTIVYNEDATLTISGKYIFSNGEPFGMVPGDLFINNAAVPGGFTMTDGIRTLTTTDTYKAGDKLNIEFYIPAGAGSVVKTPVEYVVGSVSDGPSTGVAAVEAAEAEVEYYNLQGVRVANPENGIFIRRQGNKVSKVIR